MRTPEEIQQEALEVMHMNHLLDATYVCGVVYKHFGKFPKDSWQLKLSNTALQMYYDTVSYIRDNGDDPQPIKDSYYNGRRCDSFAGNMLMQFFVTCDRFSNGFSLKKG